jgi:hypothetical protein
MASHLPNPRITEEEDCLLCFLASMELAVRVEVKVVTVTTSSTVAAAVSSAPVAASSIARVISLPSVAALSFLSSPRVNMWAPRADGGRKESTLICTLKGGSVDDAHLLVGAGVLGTVAQQHPFFTYAV